MRSEVTYWNTVHPPVGVAVAAVSIHKFILKKVYFIFNFRSTSEVVGAWSFLKLHGRPPHSFFFGGGDKMSYFCRSLSLDCFQSAQTIYRLSATLQADYLIRVKDLQ